MEQTAQQPYKPSFSIVASREVPTTPYGGVTNVTVLRTERGWYLALAQNLGPNGKPYGPMYTLPWQIGRLLHEESSEQWPDLMALRFVADEARRVNFWSRNCDWGYQHFKQTVLQMMMARRTVVGLFNQPKE